MQFSEFYEIVLGMPATGLPSLAYVVRDEYARMGEVQFGTIRPSIPGSVQGYDIGMLSSLVQKHLKDEYGLDAVNIAILMKDCDKIRTEKLRDYFRGNLQVLLIREGLGIAHNGNVLSVHNLPEDHPGMQMSDTEEEALGFISSIARKGFNPRLAQQHTEAFAMRFPEMMFDGCPRVPQSERKRLTMFQQTMVLNIESICEERGLHYHTLRTLIDDNTLTYVFHGMSIEILPKFAIVRCNGGVKRSMNANTALKSFGKALNSIVRPAFSPIDIRRWEKIIYTFGAAAVVTENKDGLKATVGPINLKYKNHRIHAAFAFNNGKYDFHIELVLERLQDADEFLTAIYDVHRGADFVYVPQQNQTY